MMDSPRLEHIPSSPKLRAVKSEPLEEAVTYMPRAIFIIKSRVLPGGTEAAINTKGKPSHRREETDLRYRNINHHTQEVASYIVPSIYTFSLLLLQSLLGRLRKVI